MAMYASRMGESLNSTVEKAIEAYVEGMENKECSEALINVQRKQTAK